MCLTTRRRHFKKHAAIKKPSRRNTEAHSRLDGIALERTTSIRFIDRIDTPFSVPRPNQVDLDGSAKSLSPGRRRPTAFENDRITREPLCAQKSVLRKVLNPNFGS